MKNYAFGAVLAATFGSVATAQEMVNLYSSRHLDTDERLYQDFTDQTGIVVNRIEGKGDQLIPRWQQRVPIPPLTF